MTYDLTIIGAGWAGFNAALRARSLGLSVCIIEKSDIGGTCLNLGCIPTKTLIQSAKVYSLAKKSRVFGIDCPAPSFDLTRVQERKESIIRTLGQGMLSLLKGVDIINASAGFLSAHELSVDGKTTIEARNILIATGSRPYELEKIKFDGKKVVSSTELLRIKSVPSSILIIGGGFIGCEFASLFNVFGSKVSIVEKLPGLLPGIDTEIGKKIAAAYRKKGIEVSTGTDAEKIDMSLFDIVLVAVGRRPNIEGLGLDRAGVKVEDGRVAVDETLKTSAGNIYACGDCAADLLLAHYAAYQGRIAAENIANPASPKKVSTSFIPIGVFSDPEIAAVGISEDAARSSGMRVRVDKFHFLGNGMARILDEADGSIKIISDSASGRLLGASIIGPRATELIAGLTMACANGLTLSAVRDTVMAHPTLSEIITDAAGTKE